MLRKIRLETYTGSTARGLLGVRRGIALRIMQLRLRAEGLSLRDVSKALADRGYASRTGRAFFPAQVARMLSA